MSLSIPMFCTVASWLGYGAIFLVFSGEYGRALGSLATIPVVVTAWCCGLKAGVLAGCVTLPLNTFLLGMVEGQETAVSRILSVTYGLSHLVFVIIGGVTGHLRDLQAQVRHQLSEKENLVAQLQQSQKMEAIGQLAGGIAHDFNNILMIMNGHASVLLNGIDKNDPSFRSLDEIHQTGEQASWLTQQLLAFSRRQTLSPQILDLNNLLADTQRLLQRLFHKNITMVTTLSSSLGKVRVDPGQMQQVMMNLVVNASDAITSGGKLSVETMVLELKDSDLKRHGVETPGRFVMLTVSDTGVGMDETTLGRVFEPFFTTKGTGKGTGLGLSTVYGIVKQSGGSLRCDSAPGQGTTFHIYLTCVLATVPDDVGENAVTDSIDGRETILLVEDDDRTRQLARGMLGQRGYTILDAARGSEALEHMNKSDKQVSLVVTDVMMPNMNGKQLSEALLARYPELKVLYISGYPDNQIVTDAADDSDGAFLQKPFTALELGRKVRQVLET